MDFDSEMKQPSVVSRLQLEHMEALGDQQMIERPVDHNLVFRSEEAARIAERKFVELGYTSKVWFSQSANPLEFYLDLQKTHAIDTESLQAVLGELLPIVAELDGEYDGWGAPLQLHEEQDNA